MGTKYRAFRHHLQLDKGMKWIVYDLPAIVRAGVERADIEQLHGLAFIDTLEASPHVDVLLASGLLQYLDVPLSELLHRLPALPRHLILNKVALRSGQTVVTLENFKCAEVPYRILNRDEFLSSIDALGYDIVDSWDIPELAHVIATHPHLGRSESRGYYARLRTADNRRAGAEAAR